MAPPRISAIRVGFFATSCAGAVVLLAAGVRSAEDPSSRRSWERGKAFYTERCIFCHGKDGRGWNLQSRIPRPPVPVPDLRDPSFMRQFTDGDLLKIIKEGGTRMGKSRFMPPAGRWLSDDDIRDVITYIRSLERSRASGDK